MTPTPPPPRPALRRSPDATISPAAPLGRPGPQRSSGGKSGAGKSAAGREAGKSAGKGERQSAAAPATTTRRPLVGRATSDTIRVTKTDKPVEVVVTIPRSLRKKLREAAKEAGVKPERLVAYLIADHVQR